MSTQSYLSVANVKVYGAKGDGSTDDTSAINSAIASGVTLANAMTVLSLATRNFCLVYAGSYTFKVY